MSTTQQGFIGNQIIYENIYSYHSVVLCILNIHLCQHKIQKHIYVSLIWYYMGTLAVYL